MLGNKKLNINEVSKLNSENIIDLRETTNHPLSLLYSEIYSQAVLYGTVSHGRMQPGFNLAGNAPFVIAAKKAIEFGNDNNQKDVIEDVLNQFYNTVQPKNAAEWLGVDFNDGHRLLSLPPWAGVLPWRARTVESYQSAFETAAIKEAQSFGYHADIKDGWLYCGPVSARKVNVEAQRIVTVLNSMIQNGYQRSNRKDGDVRATALVNEDRNWRWLITYGNHRASVASSLGYENIPIRVNLVICREHVDFWPHVVNGLYTKSQALEVFDRLFDGVTPSKTEKWEKLV